MIVLCGFLSAPVHAEFIPGDIATVGLSRIVDDTTAGNIGGHYGTYALGNNWEPYVSVLGNSTFLFESTTYAESAPAVPIFSKMRFAAAFQPAGGGPHGPGESFFGDDGNPYKGQINASRQEGNPGRIAGDKRPGARYFMVGGEASPHVYPSVFGTMPPGPAYGSTSRYGTLQLYSLGPVDLSQTMSTQAFDVLQGISGTPAVLDEVNRFGGELAALSNGNFVAVIDDRSKLVAPYRTPVATIVKPDGTVVKPAFALWPGPGDCTVWSNVAAHKNGFVIRCAACGGALRFHDNDGNFLGEANQDDPNLKDSQGNRVYFQTHRGDYTRIASHINSDYVFLAGPTTGNPFFAGPPAEEIVSVAVWAARTRTYVAQANVTEMTPAHGGVGTDAEDFAANWSPDATRVNVAVDALNRICVTFGRATAEYQYQQTAARILAFDPSSGTLTHLTHSFWPFLNHCLDPLGDCAGISSRSSSVAMTTRQICIASKGEINLANQPDLGPDFAVYNANFYTVISHPDPQDDPSCPAVYGDLDADGDLDLTDFEAFNICSNGPSRPYAGEPACACLDQDVDGDLDMTDFAQFQRCLSRPDSSATACP